MLESKHIVLILSPILYLSPRRFVLFCSAIFYFAVKAIVMEFLNQFCINRACISRCKNGHQSEIESTITFFFFTRNINRG